MGNSLKANKEGRTAITARPSGGYFTQFAGQQKGLKTPVSPDNQRV
jgi:hypothetical protein